MSNHYHLLVKTPEANLGRAMRHINGQYTLHYNRLRKQDGPLFRGRYKAILVEEDSYQLQLSRYIHRSPIEVGVVDQLEDYPWSSYPNYVSKLAAPDWLYRQEIYEQLSEKSSKQAKYRAFVRMGIDEEIAKFYGKGNQKSFLGSDRFRDWVYQQRLTNEEELSRATVRAFRPSMSEVAESVAKHFKVELQTIKISQRGRVDENIPRWVVMYLAQEICDVKLSEIATYTGLKRTGSIPTTIAKLKSRMMLDAKLGRAVSKIKRVYDT